MKNVPTAHLNTTKQQLLLLLAEEAAQLFVNLPLIGRLRLLFLASARFLSNAV